MARVDTNNLNIAQKIGQLIMPRIDFNDPSSLARARRLVERFEVGGFIIFNGMRDIVANATEELQSISKIPLLFGCDGERGAGQIVRDMTLFPFTMSLGAARDENLVYEQASFIAQEMKECGLNLLFAPVTDVNSNPHNPIINIRSYGDNPELVSRLCTAFIKGCQDNGVLACAKHFPGHGQTGIDSHIDLPVLDTDMESIQNKDLIPFEKSVEANVASIMTAHIAFSQIGDGSPVTVSKELIANLLRDKMGFEGLIITDSLHMEGIIKLGEEQYISKKALNAGCDMILDPKDPFELIPNLCSVPNPDLDHTQLDSKVERILQIKENWLIKSVSFNPSNKEDGRKLKERIARESVCVVRGEALRSRKAFICTFDVTQSENDISKLFTEHLKENGLDFNKILISLGSEGSMLNNIPDDAAVICLIYTTVGAWKKQSSLPDSFKAALTNLETLSQESVLVSFGSPYVISGFNSFKTVICSFDILDVCQQAAADVLLGKLKAIGDLPVKLD